MPEPITNPANPNGNANADGTPPAGNGATPPAAGTTQPIVPQGDVLNQTYQLVVDGQPVVLTLKEMMDRASEASGAQKKFQEAAELRKNSEKGLRIIELTQKVRSNPTPALTEVQELIGLMGGNPNDPETLAALGFETPKGNPPTSSAQNQPQGRQPVRLEDMDPSVQAALRAAEEAELARIRETVETTTKKGIDNDPVIAKMLIEIPDEQRDQIRTMLYDIAIDSVRGDVMAGQPFTPQMVQGKAQRLRAMLQTLGVGTPKMPLPGTGPASGMGGANAMIPDKPIERKPASDPNYVQNTVQRALQMQQKALAGVGRR